MRQPDNTPEPHQPSASVPLEVATALGRPDSPALRSRREHQRNSVVACRPIGLQLIDPAGPAASPWFQADILDVSLGGLCLLLMEDVPLELAPSMRLCLDVRPHPSFGTDVLPVELRWFVRSGLIVSLGVGFLEPLQELPELLVCRRSQRRPLDLDQTLD